MPKLANAAYRPDSGARLTRNHCPASAEPVTSDLIARPRLPNRPSGLRRAGFNSRFPYEVTTSATAATANAASDAFHRRGAGATGRSGGRVTVRFEDVPASEDDVVERGQGHEVFDVWGTRFGSLAKPNRAHLCQRPSRLRKALADRVDAGNRRRADCAETHEEHAEFAVGRGNMKWCGHNRPLYH